MQEIIKRKEEESFPWIKANEIRLRITKDTSNYPSFGHRQYTYTCICMYMYAYAYRKRMVVCIDINLDYRDINISHALIIKVIYSGMHNVNNFNAAFFIFLSIFSINSLYEAIDTISSSSVTNRNFIFCN